MEQILEQQKSSEIENLTSNNFCAKNKSTELYIKTQNSHGKVGTNGFSPTDESSIYLQRNHEIHDKKGVNDQKESNYFRKKFILRTIDAHANVKPFVINSEIAYNANQSYDLENKFKKFNIIILASYCETDDEVILEYFARKIRKEDIKLTTLLSNHLVQIPVIQKWNIDNINSLLSKLTEIGKDKADLLNRFQNGNEIIFLWDHEYKKFESFWIGIVNNHDKLTSEQHVLAATFSHQIQCKTSSKIYTKLFPFTKNQVNEFFEESIRLMDLKPERQKLLKLFLSSDLQNEFEGEVHVKNHVMMFKLALDYFTAFTSDFKDDVEEGLLHQNDIEEQFLQFFNYCQDLKINENLTISQILQAYSLKLIFSDEILSFVNDVEIFTEVHPKLQFLHDVKSKNEHELSPQEFQHRTVAEYFAAQFVIKRILMIDVNVITKNEAQNFLRLLSIISTEYEFRIIKKFLLSFLKIRKCVLHEYDMNIYGLLEKSTYYGRLVAICDRSEIHEIREAKSLMDILQNHHFWPKLRKVMENEITKQEKIDQKTVQKYEQKSPNKSKKKSSDSVVKKKKEYYDFDDFYL